jgi:hypothetical protein
MIKNDDTKNIVIAILAKDKENTLPFYLKCVYNQSYNKKIFIYIFVQMTIQIIQTSY